MKNTLVKIDADTICFIASKEDINNSINNVKNIINNIIEKTKATHFILCLTGHECFRFQLYPLYKQNRKINKEKYPQKLKYLKTLKSFLIEEYNAILIQSLEADDICSFQFKLPDFEQIVASADKDVLNSVVGSNYNYQFDKFIDVTQKSSDRFLTLQLLIGDTSDNIPGLKIKTDYMKKNYSLDNRSGIGEATANKILDIIESRNQNYAAEILKCYISKYEDEPASVLIADNIYRHGKTKEELGFEDYTLNRHLLQLQTGIGTYNKILENYDVRNHINEVSKIIINNVEEF